MQFMLAGLAVLSLLEVAYWFLPRHHVRTALAIMMAAALLLTSGGLLAAAFTWWSVLLAVLNAYRVLNWLRYGLGVATAEYRHFMSRQAGLYLIGFQSVVGLLAWGLHSTAIELQAVLWTVVGLQLAGAAVIGASTLRNARTTRIASAGLEVADRDLPSVSVCIAARNETSGLEACLQSLLASDYPKLEILVLDDCSQNKRTPAIIQAFAHDGVRFMAGQAPPERWLAKNYAYQQMAEVASGNILLFCGVDVRFGYRTIRTLVAELKTRRKQMISLLPINSQTSIQQLAVQPARYAWELALPRRFLNRPPVLSTCWLISAGTLRRSGQFKAARRSVVPEAYLAQQAIKQDAYSFLRGSSELGLTTVKSADEVVQTAVRVRYPQLHRRLELVFLTGAAELLVVVLPWSVLAGALLARNWVFLAASAVNCLLLLGFFGLILRSAYRRSKLFGALLLPFAGLLDVAMLHYSMWRYEFRQVIWKGRNICLPVMQVIPRLPKPD